jgi:hypothetical protein
LSGTSWEEYGFRSLKALLQTMEQKGVLRIGETEHGALAVQVEDKLQLQLEPAPSAAKNHSMSFRPLRKQFWLTFAFEEPKGKRYLNKKTVEARLGLSEAPSPPSDWLLVEPISRDVQQTWAREFLRERDLSTNASLTDALNQDDWYRSFSSALREESTELLSAWNRQRSNHVAEHVQHWCEEHGLNPETAFQRPFRKEQLKSTTALHAMSWDEDSMRRVVLDALAGAPTDWLLDLPIPSKYVFRVLTNRPGRP